MKKYWWWYFKITGCFLGTAIIIVAVIWISQNWPSVWKQLWSSPLQNQIISPKPQAAISERIGSIKRINKDQTAPAKTTGIGFLTHQQQLITAAHVLSGSDQDQFFFENETHGIISITDPVIIADQDLAYATLSTPVILASDLTFNDQPKENEPVWMLLGSGVNAQMIEGKIIHVAKTIQLMATWGEIINEKIETIMVRMENNLGDSGSPVFNAQQELIGVVIAVDLDDPNITYLSTTSTIPDPPTHPL